MDFRKMCTMVCNVIWISYYKCKLNNQCYIKEEHIYIYIDIDTASSDEKIKFSTRIDTNPILKS